MRFQDKVAAITGGASGIGLAAAERLVAEGAKVVLNGRDEAKLQRAVESLGHERADHLAGDIGDPAVGQALVEKAEARFGGLDILLNNAGIFAPKPFLELNEADYDGFLTTILKGKFFAAQAAAKAMQKRGGGAIVHTGSMWAEAAVAATPSSAYSAANAGVHALVRNLAIELAGDNIRVNGVAPAVVETPVYGTFMSEEEVAKTLPTFNAFHPLGRNGQPADVAAALLFLASDDAAWITGTVMAVDGGVTAGR
ncbi:SDR family NAD(P)-dependent oxidoreductase [Pelagibius sp.]|uniref:SDR family NAD(P)-dependent oxidoreductase n=1 Tax=Pelagibius sp. TaxID=1931238 RepID=UPI003B503356